MRWRGRRAGHGAARRRPAVPLAGPFSILITVITVGAVTSSTALAAPAVTASDVMSAAALTAAPFNGTPAVGALFLISGGQLRNHFCTASVVASPHGNVLVTAAHCLDGYSRRNPANVAFVPGYHDGRAPAGIWPVTRVFVDKAWTASGDPDDDVAFLTVGRADRSASIERVTGAERLAISQPRTSMVRVIGYPADQDQPISCQNATTAFSMTQLQFDCANYTNGTSGAPFLIDAGSGGAGLVVGVIGGYEQGGLTPDVSYAAYFGPKVLALYQAATAAG
jgi:V8-like Glu-specific endopeptidase